MQTWIKKGISFIAQPTLHTKIARLFLCRKAFMGVAAVLQAQMLLASKEYPKENIGCTKREQTVHASLQKPSPGKLYETVWGLEEAPVTLEIYTSLSCPFCAYIHRIFLPKLKEAFEKSKNLRILVHDYPTDGPSLQGSALMTCTPQEMQESLYHELMATQTTWVFAAGDIPKALKKVYQSIFKQEDKEVFHCSQDRKIMANLIIDSRNKNKKQPIKNVPFICLYLTHNPKVSKEIPPESIEDYYILQQEINHMLHRAVLHNHYKTSA